jgi:hypothetical protein
MDKIEIKKSLEGLLPRGSATKIRNTLIEAGTAKTLSVSWVSRVIDATSKHWDDDIIREALAIANKQRATLANFMQQVPKSEEEATV